MRLKDLAEKNAGDQFIFDMEKIKEIHGYNVRQMDSPETQAHIRKMADAIIAGGTGKFPPITIFKDAEDNVFVRAGYCRRRAHILAKNEGAPVLGIRCIVSEMNEAEAALDLLNSNDGLALKPLEQAKVVQRLLSFDWSPSEIARRRGVSVTAIQNLIDLIDAPEEVKEMVQKGKVSARTAVDVVRKHGAAKGTETLKGAVETAQQAGKTKATAKHLPKQTPAPAEQPASTKQGTDWTTRGPQLEKALMKIINAENSKVQQQEIMNARQFVK